MAIETPAAIGVKLGFEAHQPAGVIESGGVARVEGMALAGEFHIEMPRQPNANGPACLPHTERRNSSPCVRLNFFTSERSPHSKAFDCNAMFVDSENWGRHA